MLQIAGGIVLGVFGVFVLLGIMNSLAIAINRPREPVPVKRDLLAETNDIIFKGDLMIGGMVVAFVVLGLIVLAKS